MSKSYTSIFKFLKQHMEAMVSSLWCLSIPLDTFKKATLYSDLEVSCPATN